MLSLCAAVNRVRSSSTPRRWKNSASAAPHPVSGDHVGKACPITGAMATEYEAVSELEADPDIAAERETFAQAQLKIASTPVVEPLASRVEAQTDLGIVPLNVRNGKHMSSPQTQRLVQAVGATILHRFTTLFYKKCEVNPHLDQFIRRHGDPHGERFATWILEKFGDGTPWTDQRLTRKADVMQINGSRVEVSHDRSSAHLAAWNSPKRPPSDQGQRFKPYDARIWMRLHFWSAREVGLFKPEHAAFMDYYTRFIGHFISVYSSKAPPFTRDSARWSADPRNVERYLAANNRMTDLSPGEQSVSAIPPDEQIYTGSRDPRPVWPYDVH